MFIFIILDWSPELCCGRRWANKTSTRSDSGNRQRIGEKRTNDMLTLFRNLIKRIWRQTM